VTRPVRFEDEADAEYRAAGRWYEGRREHLGIEFFDAVDATIDKIVAMPNAGVPVPGLTSELLVRRRPVTRFPYHVVYLDTSTQIRILAIAHDRRRPGYWLRRLGSGNPGR
jgi:plasmid stabilization system protein ParE